MGAVEYVVALEQQMELVPLKRGWGVAFGGPRPPVAQAAGEPRVTADERAGTVPPTDPKRRRRNEPQPPSPRPMPDPAPSPVPDPPSTPDLPVTPRDARGGRR
jgi:hypothetical protein